jgi:flavin-dependent dehydrogenase
MVAPDYDVIVVGSGPAGSTAATLLAQQDHRVLIIEHGQHPRFHIGESMLPLSTPVFDRLGIKWDKQHYLHKNGAEFIDENTGKQVRFCLNGQYQPYQVERAPFDHMLVKNAVHHGARLQQQESVKTVDIDADGVRVTTDRGEYTSRKSEAARAMYVSGDIKVLMVDIGWIWIIPLIDNRLSIGLVVQQSIDKSQRGAGLYEQYVKASPFLTELLAGAEQETFSFSNSQRHGLRYACCGDAAGFLDPIFSSGVFLAVTSAEKVADRLHTALAAGTEGDPLLHAVDDDHYNLAFRSMQLFVERYYQYDMVNHLFFEADRSAEIKNDIAALLSGDLWRGNNNFQRMLLEGRQNRKQ